MPWSNSTGRDLSHHNPISDYDAARSAAGWVQLKITESGSYVDPMAAQHYRGFAGIPRGAYHFARPVNNFGQIKHFLHTKQLIGAQWERPDMLDCEFDGVTGTFIKDLVAEYRRQSRISTVLVYTGLANLKGPCHPDLWYDPQTPIWAARYRKKGPPAGPDAWGTHLGWDHPGLAIYQWDNATPLPGGGNTDINAQRLPLGIKEATVTCAFNPNADGDRGQVQAANIRATTMLTMATSSAKFFDPDPQDNKLAATLYEIRDLVARLPLATAPDPAELVDAMAANAAFMDGLASRLAARFADEQDRRARDGNPTTGPTT